MKDLEPKLKEQVVELCQKGIDQAERERYEPSNRTFYNVLEIIPEPKSEWKAYTWLLASIADNYFELKDYTKAEALLAEVIQRDAEYQQNGYVRMRHAQCIFELDGEEVAKEEMQLAYQLGGEELFEDEYAKYKKLAKQA